MPGIPILEGIFCEVFLHGDSEYSYQEEHIGTATCGPRHKMIVIAGPTAVGKSQLAMILARAVGGEIISADSMQVYKGADIATAKIGQKDRLEIPHHLIDVCDIGKPFNVVDYYVAAKEAYRSIVARNRVPILVGGAGFYLHTFLCGPPKGPPADPEIRHQLARDYEKFGPEMLYDKLMELDPDYACTITMLDRQKIIRALEIITITHKKVSEIPRPSQEDIPCDIDFHCWFVYYPREILYERIEKRCEEMIQNGIIDETKRLREQGLENNTSLANSIGYRQALEFLDSGQEEADWEKFVTKIKKASRHYAKRQFTWFRSEPLYRWLDLEDCTLEHAAELILQDFSMDHNS